MIKVNSSKRNNLMLAYFAKEVKKWRCESWKCTKFTGKYYFHQNAGSLQNFFLFLETRQNKFGSMTARKDDILP